MKVGVSTACMYPELLEVSLKALCERGVKLTEIFFNTHSELDESYVKELKVILDSYDAEVSSIHPYTCGIEPMMFFSHYERRFLDIIDYYKKYFYTMNLLGAKIFVFHGDKKENPYEEELYFDKFQKLTNIAREYGIIIAQENVSRCKSGDLGFLKRMSKALGDDVSFVFDVKQCVRSGYEPFEFMNALGEKIKHVHLSDHGKNGDCLLIGEGKLDLQKMYNYFVQYDNTPSIIIELYSNAFNSIDELVNNYDVVNSLFNSTFHNK